MKQELPTFERVCWNGVCMVIALALGGEIGLLETACVFAKPVVSLEGMRDVLAGSYVCSPRTELTSTLGVCSSISCALFEWFMCF
jgi:hypothetical protein